MMSDVFLRRFEELRKECEGFSHYKYGSTSDVPPFAWQKWGTSVQSIIKAVYGEDSPHYQNFSRSLEKCIGVNIQINTLIGIFLSAYEAFHGGYVFNVDLRVSGEVFGDFVQLAKQALEEGHKDVAAVLACAALEDALKRYATSSGLLVEDCEMSQVVGALKAKGLVQGAQKTLLDAMPKIRNKVMHAEWDKFTETEVGSVIGFVEQFLLKHFSL